MRKGLLLTLSVGALVCLVALGCEKEDNPFGNQDPETTLANVPPANTPDDPYFALLRVSWDGEDSDGYIIGYEFRWTTHHVAAGDSISYDWLFTTIADTTFAFESSDSINLQHFEVRAVDNDGAKDPTPAWRDFYTAQVEYPQTTITSPDSAVELFILSATTDTWDGIAFQYEGEDPDGEVSDYSWRVDDRSWSEWTTETAVVLDASDFPEPLEGWHTLSVKCRDNTMVEDPSPASIPLYLAIPTFAEGVLVVDETNDGTGLEESPTDEQVDSFYDSVLVATAHANWDYADSGMPGASALGRYAVLIWHTDDGDNEITDHLDEIGAYLNVGGKLILSGRRILYAINPQYETEWQPGTFPGDYLHISSSNVDTRPVWTGALGTGSYEGYEVLPDSAKLRSMRRGRLFDVAIMEPMPPFCESILLFQHLQEDTVFHGQPCAVEYDGTTYDAVFFGFPLYYTAEAHTRPLVEHVLSRWGQ